MTLNSCSSCNLFASFYRDKEENCLLLQELRKTLAVVKIEKEDTEAALSDSRKEMQTLEQKNKVSL